MTRRFLALHLPDLAIARLRRAEPDLPDGPLATWEAIGSRRLLVSVDGAAARLGLQPGQALADAQAIASDLLLRPAAAAEDARALHGLALWTRRYTPLAATDSPDGLILDITGCDHLWGGEAALLADALARLRRAGLAPRGAVAGAAATAAALARARTDDPVAASGIEAALAGPLPLGPALRLDAAMREDLARLGLRRVRDLLDQPRGPLARRFGHALLDRLDAVAGRRPQSIQPVLPPPDLASAMELLEPIVTRPAIDAALDRLLADLAETLRRTGRGARQVVLLAWRVDGVVQEVAIGTGRPTRDPAHLRRLFAERLERLEPDLGFERMALEARATDRMEAGSQISLGIGAGREEAVLLAQLLDRLGQRLRVQRVAPLASHWPERSVAALDPQAMPPDPPSGWSRPDSPVLRLRWPQVMEVVALLPDAPPARLRWQGMAQRVLRADGPRRLEPEWWRTPHGSLGGHRRDGYSVELTCGTRLWVCRGGADSAWRLHGHLP